MSKPAQRRRGALTATANGVALQRTIQSQLLSESGQLMQRVTALARTSASQLRALSRSLVALGHCKPGQRPAPPSAATLTEAAAHVRRCLLPLVATATEIHALIGSRCLAEQAWRADEHTVTLLSLAEQLRQLHTRAPQHEDLRCLALLQEQLETARRSASVTASTS